MKLLVVAEFSPAAAGGGAAIVRQMLAGVGSREVGWWSLHSIDGQDKPLPEYLCRSAIGDSRLPARWQPQRKFRWVKGILGENIFTRLIARRLRKFIEMQKPEKIWCIPHQWSILPSLSALSAFSSRLHVSVHDYPHIAGAVEVLGRGRAHRFFGALQSLYKLSATRDVIGPEMDADLFRLTGRRTNLICRKAVEACDIQWLQHAPCRSGPTIKIAYAGTIVCPSVFRQLVKLLGSARNNLQHSVELHLFGAHSYAAEPWFESTWMRENGNVSEESLRMHLREMDAGIALMDVDSENSAYYEYSFPAKFSSYLGSGLPVIAAGHENSTLVKMMGKHRVGIVLDLHKSDFAEKKLGAFLASTNLHAFYREAILDCIREEFDATTMRSKLHYLLGMKNSQ